MTADTVRRAVRLSQYAMKGRAWADRVYAEKLESGDLPHLGAGFSDELRAARAVAGIADRKLYTRARGSSVRTENPLRPGQRQFWFGVLERAGELAVAAGHAGDEGGSA